MRTVIRERDLRSLARPGLRRAFRPLDPTEWLPRELVVDPGIAVRGVGSRVAALLALAVFFVGLAVLARLTSG